MNCGIDSISACMVLCCLLQIEEDRDGSEIARSNPRKGCGAGDRHRQCRDIQMTGHVIRQIVGAVIFYSIVSAYAAADPLQEGRIAIIDVSHSLVANDAGRPIKLIFEDLRKSGVLVIGRYFSRCEQHYPKTGKFWRKRLIDGDPNRPDGEAQAILQNGFAIMSIYQYNNREDKFAGRFKGPACIKTRYEKEISTASPQAREGILDAEAALDQAAKVKQPKNTVIYFGVDYRFDKNNRRQRDGVLAYFREIRKQFDAAGYRIGAYADGDALSLLMGDNPKNEKLIDIAWLLPSTSFPGNSDFHTNKHWHLFQSQADNNKLVLDHGTCIDVEYDVNIQNIAAAGEDLGFWDKNGSYKVPEARTTAIFNQRRFVCDRRELRLQSSVESCGTPFTLRSCAKTKDGEPCFARTVRVNPDQKGGDGTLQIDFRDYGKFDGSIEQRRLTQSLAVKPLYAAAPWASKQSA